MELRPEIVPVSRAYARESTLSPVAPRSYIAGRASERRVELRGRDGRALVEDTRMRRGGGTSSRDGR